MRQDANASAGRPAIRSEPQNATIRGTRDRAGVNNVSSRVACSNTPSSNAKMAESAQKRQKVTPRNSEIPINNENETPYNTVCIPQRHVNHFMQNREADRINSCKRSPNWLRPLLRPQYPLPHRMRFPRAAHQALDVHRAVGGLQEQDEHFAIR